jgi:hypothetical protein
VAEDQILGIKYGLSGFYTKGAKPVTLTRHAVDGIHLKGGTMLVSLQCENSCRGEHRLQKRAWLAALWLRNGQICKAYYCHKCASNCLAAPGLHHLQVDASPIPAYSSYLERISLSNPRAPRAAASMLRRS